MSKDILKPLAAGFAIFLCAGAAPAVELTANGGFETGNYAAWTQFPAAGVNTITTVNPASGTYAARLNVTVLGQGDVIKQANIGIGIVTPNGQAVHIEFDARGTVLNGGVAFAEFFSELGPPGGTSKTEILSGGPLALNADPNVWTRFVFDTTTGPDVTGGVTLQLKAATGGDVGSVADVYYDNASVSVAGVGVDTDGDGLLDPFDNCRLVQNALAGDVPGTAPAIPKFQLDSDTDGFGNRCDGDFNNTGAAAQVNTTDYTIFRSVINKPYTFSTNAARSDLNASGTVDTTDYTIFRSLINKLPGPSGLACAGTIPCP